MTSALRSRPISRRRTRGGNIARTREPPLAARASRSTACAGLSLKISAAIPASRLWSRSAFHSSPSHHSGACGLVDRGLCLPDFPVRCTWWSRGRARRASMSAFSAAGDQALDPKSGRISATVSVRRTGVVAPAQPRAAGSGGPEASRACRRATCRTLDPEGAAIVRVRAMRTELATENCATMPHGGGEEIVLDPSRSGA